jgi:Asp-tRNA(Asn)/Glu-tRNA(Gln) amidotransferase A subunit family amidase
LHKTLEFIDAGLRQVNTLLSDNGVFVIPAYPSPSKPHGRIYGEIFSLTLSFKKVMPFTALANTFGLPAMVVPCGRSKEGLPIGLQIVANHDNEKLLFQAAAFLEKKFGGYKRCTDYDE